MSRLLLLCAAALGSVGAYVLTAPAAPSRSRAAPLRMEEGVASLGLQETMPNQKSWMPKADDLALDNKKWYVVDAEGLRLGRMASEVAKILLGKHKASYTPGATMGDFVVITNCEKVIVTGKKAETKLYRRHSGRPGGMKVEVYKDLQQRIPERIVEKAVVGMLPKNSYGRELFRHLKVYKGAAHPHEAQVMMLPPLPAAPASQRCLTPRFPPSADPRGAHLHRPDLGAGLARARPPGPRRDVLRDGLAAPPRV